MCLCVFPILAPRAIRRTNNTGMKYKKGFFFKTLRSEVMASFTHLEYLQRRFRDPSAVLSMILGSKLLRKPIATVSLHRQRTSRRQRASHLHRFVNGECIRVTNTNCHAYFIVARACYILGDNRSRIFSVFACTCARSISHERHGYTDVVFAPTTYCDSLLATPTLLLWLG